ncbi:MAG: hypothetical protein WDA20_01920 [Desulfuromonadales bacterium]|jgi:mono/diheme cytochrome c family protein
MSVAYKKVIRWVKIGVFFGGLGGAVVGGLFLYELVMGPRMRLQIHLRPFEAAMPAPPAESVPVHPAAQLPAEAPAERLENPIGSSPEALARGKVYYDYYCVFCHGEDGFGAGPVGQSYMPVPADLRKPAIQNYSDGRLLRAMLTGIGHEPVLPRVVRPEYRWYLVLYTRQFATKASERPSGRD